MNTALHQKNITLIQALIPVMVLIALLAFNVSVFGDEALSGSNQFILLIGGAVASIVGFAIKVDFKTMMNSVAENIRSTTGAILILLMVGALAGTWLIGGIIPAMIYYGLKILHPDFFLPAAVVICAVVSVATGSSWTTAATVGVALIGIGKAIGVSEGMAAGAVISGAYFGDKVSPLSDTTNLAAAMARVNLFKHIRYMMLTTIPSIVFTLLVFSFLSMNISSGSAVQTGEVLNAISKTFHITPLVFVVPAIVVGLILLKTEPLIALMVGTLLGALCAIIFQSNIIAMVAGAETLDAIACYKCVLNAITIDTKIPTDNEMLNELFSSKGMKGMLSTVWLIVCAMVFGGVMEAIGALERISRALLSVAKSVFGLFASTVASCLALNIAASDQYLSIVVPGKMYADAFDKKDLAPENLSRTLEDAGTVTSVLIPWNTCGAYQSGVLGVSVADYFVYAIFNYVSPLMTLLFAALQIKIKMLRK